MIKQEDLVKAYNHFSLEKELTTNELKLFGLTEHDFTHLIEDGILIRVKNDHYKVTSVNELFLYIVKYYPSGEICSEKNVQLFFLYLHEKNKESKNMKPFQTVSLEENTYLDILQKKLEEVSEDIEDIIEDSSSRLSSFLSSLQVGDFQTSLLLLKNYLSKIKRIEYQDFIINLIKLSRLEKDNSFEKIKATLISIEEGNVELEISKEIQKFYECTMQGKIEEARVYLNVITSASEIGNCFISIDNLENMIEKKEQDPKEQKTDLELTKEEDYTFVKEKIKELMENGIVLLNPMDPDRRERIHHIVSEFSDIDSFSIGTGLNTRIVLRFKPYISERLDIPELIKMGSSSYQKGDYDSAILYYRELLEFGTPHSTVYGKLGLTYMKKEKIKLAIDYLTIATELAKNEGKDYDYSELIEKLKRKTNRFTKKTESLMKVEDFEQPLDNYYGIENISEVANLVLSGMDLNEAFDFFGYEEEQRNMITLIFARECYFQEDYSKGDHYLKLVEKSPNKSAMVKNLFEEVQKNKRFYKNRVSEKHKALALVTKKEVKP